mgnify:FL=1
MTLEDFSKGRSNERYSHIWLGIPVRVPDQNVELDPEQIESDIRKWTDEFLREGLSNVDLEATGEGVDILSAEKNWNDNPLYVRYKSEYFSEDDGASIHKNRRFMVWFPARDTFEHHMLDTLKEKYHYLIGDEVMEKYDRIIDVGGVLIRADEDTVRFIETNGTPVDDFDKYVS